MSMRIDSGGSLGHVNVLPLCNRVHSFLMEYTNLDEVELMKTIQSLIDNKLLLVKEGTSVCVRIRVSVGICFSLCVCLYTL